MAAEKKIGGVGIEMKLETEDLQKGLVRVQKSMKDFGSAMTPAEKKLAEIELQSKKTGSAISKTGNEMDNTAKKTGGLAGGLGLLKSSFFLVTAAIYAAYNALKAYIGANDTFIRIQNSLRQQTDGTAESIKNISDKIFKMATDNFTPVEGLAKAFNRFNFAIKDQEKTLVVLDSVTKSLALMGAGAAETDSVMLQLGQALGSGVLRGEEFNAVFEASPKIIEMISKEMGVSIGKMREMAENGEISADIVTNALIKGNAELTKSFESSDKTVEQLMTNMRTEITKAIGETDKVLGAGNGVKSMVASFTETVPKIASVLQENADGIHLFMKWMGNAISFIGRMFGNGITAIFLGFTLLNKGLTETLGRAIGYTVAFGMDIVENFSTIVSNIGVAFSKLGNLISIQLNKALGPIETFVNKTLLAISKIPGAGEATTVSLKMDVVPISDLKYQELTSKNLQKAKATIDNYSADLSAQIKRQVESLSFSAPEKFVAKNASGSSVANSVSGGSAPAKTAKADGKKASKAKSEELKELEKQEKEYEKKLDQRRDHYEKKRKEIAEKYKKEIEDTRKEIEKLEEDHGKMRQSVQADLRSIQNDMAELQKSYEKTISDLEKGFSKDVAGGVVELQAELAKLKKDLEEANAEGGWSGYEKQLELQKEIKKIQDEISVGQSLVSQDAIDEASRRAGLGEFAKMKEDLDSQKAEEQAKYEEDLDKMEEKAAIFQAYLDGNILAIQTANEFETQLELEKLALEQEQFNERSSALNSFLEESVQKNQSALERIDRVNQSITANLISQWEAVKRARESAQGGGFSEGGQVGETVQQFAGGGRVRGAGSEKSDSIPAMLSDGEFVINAAASRLYAPLLNAINSSDRAVSQSTVRNVSENNISQQYTYNQTFQDTQNLNPAQLAQMMKFYEKYQ